MPLRLNLNSWHLARWAVVGAILAVSTIACEDASGGARSTPPTTSAALRDGLPVVMSVRPVCRLAGDTPGADAARITGVDGSQSAVSGGRSYWFFGDTVRRAGDRQDVIPAAVATTDDVDARDCLDLRFKTAADGAVAPMFPRRDETTAWPDGVLTLDDGSIVFYMVKAIRTSPFAWHVGSVGLGRIPAGSVDGERVVETIWDENSGFGSPVVGVRSPVRVGDDVIVYLRTEDDRNYVARAQLAKISESAAYTYWDGSAWSSDAGEAEAMWESAPSEYGFPADNGVQVSFDERTGKWLALYNRNMASTEVRTADEPWGPWSAPVAWFDCQQLVEDQYPYCYTGELHRQLTRDSGETLYMTISSQQPYDVTLLELHMGTAVHEWRSAVGVRRYGFATPGAGYADAGVVFYASVKPAFGLSPVYEIARGEAFSYSLEGAEDARPAFYAYSTSQTGAVTTAAVRSDGAALAVGGASGDVQFFVPCPAAGCD